MRVPLKSLTVSKNIMIWSANGNREKWKTPLSENFSCNKTKTCTYLVHQLSHDHSDLN